MSTSATLGPGWAHPAIRRLTVAEYRRMGDAGILTPEDRVELLDGLLVTKPMKKPTHSTATELVRDALAALLPGGWCVRGQEPIALDDSEPEPDAVIARGRIRDYHGRHPTPADLALVVEVADTSLDRDRDWKRRIYARNGIPAYWIVNLIDRTLEVYTDPSGPVLTPDYAAARFLSPADAADVVVGGAVVGSVRGADVLP